MLRRQTHVLVQGCWLGPVLNVSLELEATILCLVAPLNCLLSHGSLEFFSLEGFLGPGEFNNRKTLLVIVLGVQGFGFSFGFGLGFGLSGFGCLFGKTDFGIPCTRVSLLFCFFLLVSARFRSSQLANNVVDKSHVSGFALGCVGFHTARLRAGNPCLFWHLLQMINS